MIGRMIITLMLPAVFATSAQGVPHAGEYGSLVQDNNKTDMESISIGSAWADSSRVYDLDEVVVVAYGTQKKDDLTGSITSIGEKDFNEGLISSPEQLINGKVAGVQIVSAGGSPTSSSTIRIRGGASLNASNDPLIVLDGVPMEVGGSVSGSGNFLSLINPNDIESMTILKDASSTAIYGSRASNGVIIITTKKGGEDKIKVSLQTTHSFQTKTKTADMLSRNEFIDVVNTYGTAAQQALLGNADTDWNDEIFKTAYGTDNNLSVSGRFIKNFPFRVSIGYTNQDGILRTDNSTRYTGNINLSPSFFDDYLKLNLSVKGTWNNNRFAPTGTIWNASAMNPTIPVYSDEGMFGGYNEAHPTGTESVVTGAMANPVGEINQRKDTSKVYRFIGNFSHLFLDIFFNQSFLFRCRGIFIFNIPSPNQILKRNDFRCSFIKSLSSQCFQKLIRIFGSGQKNILQRVSSFQNRQNTVNRTNSCARSG